MRKLQRQFVISTAHAVDEVEAHPECTRLGCLEVNRLIDQFERAMAAVNRRQRRSFDHRPSPADSFYGGAYTMWVLKSANDFGICLSSACCFSI